MIGYKDRIIIVIWMEPSLRADTSTTTATATATATATDDIQLQEEALYFL